MWEGDKGFIHLFLDLYVFSVYVDDSSFDIVVTKRPPMRFAVFFGGIQGNNQK